MSRSSPRPSPAAALRNHHREPPPPPGSQPVERLTDTLETPSLDDRDYRVIRLANELEALLVHDAETDKASAALDVNVGNFSDPEDMPGMAHAVEHVSCLPPLLSPRPCIPAPDCAVPNPNLS